MRIVPKGNIFADEFASPSDVIHSDVCVIVE